MRLMHKFIFYKNILVQSLMTPSGEWLKGTSSTDFAVVFLYLKIPKYPYEAAEKFIKYFKIGLFS
mgnify:CR=1 FL=1